MSSFTIRDLERLVNDRARESADVSYTRKLLDAGVNQCAKKFGEEAIEAAIAAVDEDRDRLVREAADVLYHLLVLSTPAAFRLRRSRPNSARAATNPALRKKRRAS